MPSVCLLEEVVEEGAELALAVAEVHQRDLVLLGLGERVGLRGVLVDRMLQCLEEAELGLGGELRAAATTATAAALLVELGDVLLLLERFDHGVELLDDAGLGELGGLAGLLLAQVVLHFVHRVRRLPWRRDVIDDAAELAEGVAELGHASWRARLPCRGAG